MPVNDELGKRMKENYENRSKTYLLRRTPVAIRIDGKAFHTFTRGFKKPFDEILIKSMQDTTKFLCENIQGCVFGYTQSDEITLILVDYQELNSDAWFDYSVQKLCSVSASMATLVFNRFFNANMSYSTTPCYIEAAIQGAFFDARAFNIPREEVTNLLYWRQVDAMRNSVQMVGQAYFSQTQLNKKSAADIKEMLMEDVNINWNDFPIHQQRGTSCYKVGELVERNGEIHFQHKWKLDLEMPILNGEGRAHVDNCLPKN